MPASVSTSACQCMFVCVCALVCSVYIVVVLQLSLLLLLFAHSLINVGFFLSSFCLLFVLAHLLSLLALLSRSHCRCALTAGALSTTTSILHSRSHCQTLFLSLSLSYSSSVVCLPLSRHAAVHQNNLKSIFYIIYLYCSKVS